MKRTLIVTAFWLALWFVVSATIVSVALHRMGAIPAAVLCCLLAFGILWAIVPISRVVEQERARYLGQD